MINYLSMETTSVSRRGEGGGRGHRKMTIHTSITYSTSTTQYKLKLID